MSKLGVNLQENIIIISKYTDIEKYFKKDQPLFTDPTGQHGISRKKSPTSGTTLKEVHVQK